MTTRLWAVGRAEAVLAFITRRVTVNLIKGTTEDGEKEVLDADDYWEILLSHSYGGLLILWPLDNWHRAASHSQVTVAGRVGRSVDIYFWGTKTQAEGGRDYFTSSCKSPLNCPQWVLPVMGPGVSH